MFDDPRERLEWMNSQLLDDEEDDDEFEDVYEDREDGLGPGYNYAVDFGRTVFDDEDPHEEAVTYEKPSRKRGNRGLVFLAFLEIIGILAVIGWWLKWLI